MLSDTSLSRAGAIVSVLTVQKAIEADGILKYMKDVN